MTRVVSSAECGALPLAPTDPPPPSAPPAPTSPRKRDQVRKAGPLSFDTEEEEGHAEVFSLGAVTAAHFGPLARPPEPTGRPRKQPRKEPAHVSPSLPPPPPPPSTLRPPTLVWSVAEAKGKRPYMEDRYLVMDDMGAIDGRLRGLHCTRAPDRTAARVNPCLLPVESHTSHPRASSLVADLSVLDGHGGIRAVDFAKEHLHGRIAAALLAEVPTAAGAPDAADAPAACSSSDALGTEAASTGVVSPSSGWRPKKRHLLAAAAAAAEPAAAAAESTAGECGESIAGELGRGAPPEQPAPAPEHPASARDSSSTHGASSSRDAGSEGDAGVISGEVGGFGGEPSSEPSSEPPYAFMGLPSQTAADLDEWEAARATPAPPPPPPTSPPAAAPTLEAATGGHTPTTPPTPPPPAPTAYSPTAPAARAPVAAADARGRAVASAFPTASDASIGRAFATAFASVDRDFLHAARANSYGDGTTVLCALLRGFTLDIANVGDTRAVLGRKSEAHPRFSALPSGRVMRERDLEAVRLSVDHKPNLAEEAERVAAAGGQVRNISGCWRVAGPPGCSTLLAVSRAIGDRDLKDAAVAPAATALISCEPQMLSRPLSPQDRLLILATDGLWDVVNDAQAVKIACEAARRVASTEAAAKAAAETLVRRAGELGSLDNVTVLVAWVEWAHEAEAAPATPAASTPGKLHGDTGRGTSESRD